MKSTSMLIAILLRSGLSLSTQAQDVTKKISGIIVDDKQVPIANATVKLSSKEMNKITVTNGMGNFFFPDVINGVYKLTISHLNFAAYKRDSIVVSDTDPEIQLTIKLIPKINELKEVQVVTEKPFIEQKIDKMVVNVQKQLTFTGLNALDVLASTPGVTVDGNESISLQGRQGVLILLDGRQIYLSGQNLATFLKSISSKQIDQIEIMVNPSSKYDAEGSAGVINIITRRSLKKGLSGNLSVELGYGHFPKLNNALNLSYNGNKVRIYTSLNYRFTHNRLETDFVKNFFQITDPTHETIFDQTRFYNRTTTTFNSRLGSDYNINKRNTAGFFVTALVNPTNAREDVNENVYFANQNLSSQNHSFTNRHNLWNNWSSNFYYKRLLDTSGQELYLNIDHLQYKNNGGQKTLSSYYDVYYLPLKPTDTLVREFQTNVMVNAVTLDYTKSLQKKGKIEAGLKFSSVRTNNNAINFSIMNNISILDTSTNNHFLYKEQIVATYFNFNKPLFKRLSFQGGIRVENTSSTGRLITINYSFNRNYTEIFPTGYFNYLVDRDNNLNFSYSRRVRRPDYGDLNPFLYYVDKYTYDCGNPDLKPQFSNNFELQYNHKGHIIASVNYNNVKNIIQQAIEPSPLDSTVTLFRKINIARETLIGFSLIFSSPLFKWWSVNLNSNLYKTLFQRLRQQVTRSEQTTYNFNLRNKFTIKDWTVEVSGLYRSPSTQGTFELKASGTVSLGVSKSIFHDKGSLILDYLDFLNLQKAKGYGNYGNVFFKLSDYKESRVLYIGVEYSFGKQERTSARRKYELEEMNRVNF